MNQENNIPMVSTPNTNLFNSFQIVFNYVKKIHHVKKCRKSEIDSLLKKIKGKFCKALHQALCLCLNLRVKRLPQDFITNIKIELNRSDMQKTLFEIYHRYNILPPTCRLDQENLFRKDKRELYLKIIHSTYFELFQEYHSSCRFISDFNEVVITDGVKLSHLYEFVAKNFCNYFLYVKGSNKKFKPRPKRVFFLVNHNSMIFD